MISSQWCSLKKIAEVSSNYQFTPGKYIACAYDDECYIALIHEYPHENRDVSVIYEKEWPIFIVVWRGQ